MTDLDLTTIANCVHDRALELNSKAHDEEYGSAERFKKYAEAKRAYACYYDIKAKKYEEFGEGWELELKLAKHDAERARIEEEHYMAQAEAKAKADAEENS
jgi:hypothetical protein